jgi:UDP-N-acetylmuramoyl-tripeptide--D-alanyl-D-alanine ligase
VAAELAGPAAIGRRRRRPLRAAGRPGGWVQVAAPWRGRRAGRRRGAAAEALSAIAAPVGRGARREVTLPGGGAFTLLDESYNANPASMRAAFSVLATTAPGPGGRRIAVLGDMRELGETAPRLHAALAEPLAAAGVDMVFCCGPLISISCRLPAALRGAQSDLRQTRPSSRSRRTGDVTVKVRSERMAPIVNACQPALGSCAAAAL